MVTQVSLHLVSQVHAAFPDEARWDVLRLVRVLLGIEVPDLLVRHVPQLIQHSGREDRLRQFLRLHLVHPDVDEC